MGGGYVRVGAVVVSREPIYCQSASVQTFPLIASEHPGVLFIVGWDNADSMVWEKCVRLWVCMEMETQRGRKDHRGQIFTACSHGVRVCASLCFGVVRLSSLRVLDWRGGWGLGAGRSPWQQPSGCVGPLEVQGERQSGSIFKNWECECQRGDS